MKTEVKTQWIAALRSGTYQQTNSALCKNGSYCCLGVLCEITPDIKRKKAQISPWDKDTTIEIEFAYKDENYRSGYLPSQLASEVGLSEEQQSKLANMNDEGISFVEIAGYIEQAIPNQKDIL